jgi:hypothetical protein
MKKLGLGEVPVHGTENLAPAKAYWLVETAATRKRIGTSTHSDRDLNL